MKFAFHSHFWKFHDCTKCSHSIRIWSVVVHLPKLLAVFVSNWMVANTNPAYWVHRRFLRMHCPLAQKFHRKGIPMQNSTVVHWLDRLLQLNWNDATWRLENQANIIDFNRTFGYRSYSLMDITQLFPLAPPAFSHIFVRHTRQRKPYLRVALYPSHRLPI